MESYNPWPFASGWYLSLSIMLSRFVNIVAVISTSFLLLLNIPLCGLFYLHFYIIILLYFIYS